MAENGTAGAGLAGLDPAPRLLARTAAELSAAFQLDRPVRLSRAPGRLDVMGGIADYTGSMVLQRPLASAAAILLQERTDRALQIFSFNLFDEHRPFTFHMPLEALAMASAEALRREFAEPGRQWAAFIAGCLFVLNEQGFIDLRDPAVTGLNVALLSTVPRGAGVSSSAAVEVAIMLNFADHFGLRAPFARKQIADGLLLAGLCQQAEHRVVGAPRGIKDQVTCCLGEDAALLRMVCQPHELKPALRLPPGVRVLGIDSNVKHSPSGGEYGHTRCAAFMGHKIIMGIMRDMGTAAGRELVGDPMRGFLANLDPNDYKNIFRPRLPDTIAGLEFLERHGPTSDTATTVNPSVEYAIRHATDHHVLEARRVERFAQFIEQAAAAPSPMRHGSALDRAGHLMYASHQSYAMDAMLGARECDLLVSLVRQRERAGLYGARITGSGGGGTVAVLADEGGPADAALAEIAAEYEKQTGRRGDILSGSSPGAWHAGTALLKLPG